MTTLWPDVLEEEGALIPAQLFRESHARRADGPAPYAGTLREFSRTVFPQFQWYRHVEVLAERLEAVVAGELTRLMTFEPPRHGKSLLQSRIFPAYYLAKRPDRWVGLCSYEATLAQDFSRTARDNFLRVGGNLRGDSAAVNLWQTTQGGGLWASGVGGPITGKGFHVGCIDDPLKNSEEAASETIRKKQKSWYESTFFTRAEPGAAIILTMTRWHEDDLAGWLLSRELEDPEQWHIVNLPAIKDSERVVFPVTCTVSKDWRKEGEALCPERYDRKALLNIFRKVGSRVKDALYQQRPAPDSGTIFKREWWKFYVPPVPKGVHPDDLPPRPRDAVELPAMDYVIQSWDMTFKDTEQSDYVAGHVWGIAGNRFFLLDRINDRLSFSASCAAMRTMTGKWPQAIGKYVEDAANGPAIVNALQRDVMGIVAVKPDGGKVARAYAVQALVQSGNVYLPHPSTAPWVEDYIRQLAGFPNAAHDDDVDATTQALNQLAWSARSDPPPERDPGDDRHPGFDYKARKRKPKPVYHGPDVDPRDDDLRANHYHVPRTVASQWKMPRFGQAEDDE